MLLRRPEGGGGGIAALLLCLCLWALIGSSSGVYCPSGCNCYQRTLRCIRARLQTIPRAPTDTTVLDLRFNRFNRIEANTFDGLSQVTTLFLNANDISVLDEGAFNGLRALRFLYLSNNRISKLPANLFQQLPQLEAIHLDNNLIADIDVNQFYNLPRLTRLFLFSNKLQTIKPDTFNNLPSLKRLRLDGNEIICDCGIYSLWQQYQQEQQHPQRKQVVVALTCAAPPPLARLTFDKLKAEHFHCKKPEILSSPHDMHLVYGESVELPCEVIGDPAPEVIWMQNTNEISRHYSSPRMQVLSSGSLRISNVDSNDIGIYECIGRNEMGEAKSQPIRMMIEQQQQHQQQSSNYYTTAAARHNLVVADEPPKFVHRPADQTVALNGDAVRLDCTASGVPQPEIQWYFNGRLISQSTEAIHLEANGSLVIVSPSLLDAGQYRCEASNAMDTIQASATIDVKELPEILMAPQNQTIKVGKKLVLECDADGNPIPSITWEFNGSALVSNANIKLDNENTELIIEAVKPEHAGVYKCIAENENGRTQAEATIAVISQNTAPVLVIEPFNLEAFTGTTIELPCKAEDPEGLQITWRRDGRLIDPNAFLESKYEISGAGSLFVKNVTLLDSGRYECSLRNEYGRATASALVTIKSLNDLAPGDRYVRIAFEEAAREIDMAINNTLDVLFTNRTQRLQANGAPSPPSYTNLLRVFRFPTGEARQLARAAEIYERTLVNIRKHVQRGDNLTVESDQYEFRDLLSREHLHLVAELSGCMEHREMPNCTDMCYHSKYRSIDGTCNNLQNPTWGASLTAFRRLEKPIYENGFSMPVGWMKGKLYAGYPKPSARLISTTLVATEDITPDDIITHMVMQWGQFLDHDLDHAIPSVSSESWDGVDCKKTCDFAPPCYPIEVPPNDPRVKNRRCIDVVRSSSICGSGMTSLFFDSVQHREQINQLTSYIDASQVYGFSYDFAQELRNLTTDDGLLRVGVHFPNQKDMLPFAAPQDGMDCRRNLDENTMNCFTAGDIRVNEQVGLLAMHTIWMREHNRIALKLREINPHWDGDTIYQEARKIVGAQMQHITYKHWLPLIIGESGMRMLGEYRGYDPTINPTIANEFATAALRFGHTIINPILSRLNSSFEPIPQGHLPLHKAFFAPWRLAYEGGVDPLMRGMFAVPAKLKMPDQNLNTELTEKLFHTAHAVALDLAAINVQRGRDHGIPGYNVYRRFCNLSVATTFDDLSVDIKDAGVREKLQQLYGHPDNMDVWLGGILEETVPGGKVGPLFQCMLVEQFRRLRDGDRFYYENPSVFLPAQLAQIKQSNLGRVLCDVGDDIKQVTDNVFILPKQQPGGLKHCEDIVGINLYFWQDCGTCNSLPPLLDTYVPQTYVKRRSKRDIAQLPEFGEEHETNELETLMELNEERVSGLEEVVSSFQKELKKLHKKLHKLEATCAATTTPAAISTTAPVTIPASTPAQPTAAATTKPRNRSHCVDDNGTTRLNNEIWSPDNCTKCSCRHAQVNCTHEQCPELKCDELTMQIVLAADACCPHCAIKQ